MAPHPVNAVLSCLRCRDYSSLVYPWWCTVIAIHWRKSCWLKVTRIRGIVQCVALHMHTPSAMWEQSSKWRASLPRASLSTDHPAKSPAQGDRKCSETFLCCKCCPLSSQWTAFSWHLQQDHFEVHPLSLSLPLPLLPPLISLSSFLQSDIMESCDPSNFV